MHLCTLVCERGGLWGSKVLERVWFSNTFSTRSEHFGVLPNSPRVSFITIHNNVADATGGVGE